ncbi:MAG: hypothetical protein QOC79_15, partial [Actinomycetota bacterium]|nr:hypothetical protein [Actinomycetota bacterium]
SPNCCIGLGDARAVGFDGEDYEWTRLYVLEFRDGLLASVRQFELDDEDAAFAYAETIITPETSRLAVSNRASRTLEQAIKAMQAHDADTTAGFYAERFTYDDRRQLSGDPINGRAGVRDAAERILAQYTRFEGRTLAVRGERSQLSWSRWSDDDGNEATNLRLIEVDDDGRIAYEGRFDEDDFEGAYRVLERRYYAGEGAAYAESGATATDAMIAHNRGDFDRIFGELSAPDMRIENRSRSAFPDRTAAELRASTEELQAMFVSVRAWYSAMCWLSPNWGVGRMDREALGPDGENYEWIQLYVSEIRDGVVTSMCAFDVVDEDAAFAYAEERMRATSSRLALTNRATEVVYRAVGSSQAQEFDAVVATYSDQFVFDDRRRFGGDPIEGRAALRAASERVREQYSHVEPRTLAVRGGRLLLASSRWSDDSGNETTYLHVIELDDDGRIGYDGRFDEDDFEGAYRELDRRYYAGEGAAFAEGGSTLTDLVIALNRGDLDRAFRNFATPDAVMENRSRSVFGDRSGEEFRASIEELHAMVASSRVWYSAVCWVSAAWVVTRAEREAVGRDGEQYTWTKAYALEILNGRPAAACEFDLEDEESAFAYAEERVRATTPRLAVTNRASEVAFRIVAALQARDVEGAVAPYSDQVVYDDRRRLSGDPVAGHAEMRAATERILEQYSVFENRTLAVRGERLQLSSTRWSDDAGNETNYLHVFELGDDGRVAYAGRFDEDDFEGAYRELDRRYYVGEGAAFSEWGTASHDWMLAMNRGDLDRAFGELSTPDLRIENRSRALFPDRSAAEFRSSLEELRAMVASVRTWISAACWVSPTWSVARFEREAVGLDGEQYAWTRVLVAEVRDGRLASMCEFELDDEESAFAYAEERMRAASSRLAVTNRASEVMHDFARAFEARDADAIGAAYSEQFVYDDRRRLSGDPIAGYSEMRAAAERVFEQYSVFESRTLAVRGERLELSWSRWSDDAGNATDSLGVFEVGDDGRIAYAGRFDEDDFEGAYRELDRRYYAGEGVAAAEAGGVLTEVMIAMTQN